MDNYLVVCLRFLSMPRSIEEKILRTDRVFMSQTCVGLCSGQTIYPMAKLPPATSLIIMILKYDKSLFWCLTTINPRSLVSHCDKCSFSGVSLRQILLCIASLRR